MYGGQIVEHGPARLLFERRAIPTRRAAAGGARPRAARTEPGTDRRHAAAAERCRAQLCVRSRCAFAIERCRIERPERQQVDGRVVLCHRASEVAAARTAGGLADGKGSPRPRRRQRHLRSGPFWRPRVWRRARTSAWPSTEGEDPGPGRRIRIGKTTLGRHGLGLMEPDQGSVLLRRHPLRGRRAGIGGRRGRAATPGMGAESAADRGELGCRTAHHPGHGRAASESGWPMKPCCGSASIQASWRGTRMNCPVDSASAFRSRAR